MTHRPTSDGNGRPSGTYPDSCRFGVKGVDIFTPIRDGVFPITLLPFAFTLFYGGFTDHVSPTIYLVKNRR